MSKQNQWYVLIALAVALFTGSTAMAQAPQPADQTKSTNQAKAELQSIYKRWHQANPNGTVTDFFANVLVLAKNDPSLKKAGWGGQDALLKLPSGGLVLKSFVPDNAKFAGFWVDVNGQTAPNRLRDDQVIIYVGP